MKNKPGSRPTHSWQLQTAKAKFSEVFRLTRDEGPQLITRQGRDAVVMIAIEDYEKLIESRKNPKTLVQFLRESPFVGLELEFERVRDTDRKLDL